MIRNQIIALHYALNVVLVNGTVTEEHLSKMHELLLKETPEAALVVWDKAQKAGQYRTVPMQAASFPLTVYPVRLFSIYRVRTRLSCYQTFSFTCSNCYYLIVPTRSSRSNETWSNRHFFSVVLELEHHQG